MKKTIKLFVLFIFLFSLLLTGCQNETDINDEIDVGGNALISSESNYTLDESKKIALDFISNLNKSKGERRSSDPKNDIKEIYEIAAFDTCKLFVFNLTNEGFVVVNPMKKNGHNILAFSDENNISDTVLNSTAFSLWKDYVMERLLVNNNNNLPQTEEVIEHDSYIMPILRKSFNRITAAELEILDNYLDSKFKKTIDKAPLLQTNWHQRSPYNDLCPNQYPAGCVAIALGQIMNYHQKSNVGYPRTTSWDWNQINRSQNPDVSEFICYIGRGVHMSYGKNGSHPDIWNLNLISNLNYREETFLKQNNYKTNCKGFGYATVPTVVNEIVVNNRPVFMSGFKKQIIIPIDGHSWVADGVFSYKGLTIRTPMECVEICMLPDMSVYERVSIGSLIKRYFGTYIHYNLGWGGKGNGWYSDGISLDVNQSIQSIEYKTHMKMMLVSQ